MNAKMAIILTRIVSVRKGKGALICFLLNLTGVENFIFLLFVDCDCDLQGTLGEVCDKSSGQCLCKDGYETPRCDHCLPGFWNYPQCEKCNCSTVGSASFACDAFTGKCPCLNNFAGKQCTQCSAGNYDYPQCLRKLRWRRKQFHHIAHYLVLISMLQHVIVNRLVRMVFRVMPKANVRATVISMVKRAVIAKRVSVRRACYFPISLPLNFEEHKISNFQFFHQTISLHAKNAIVIRLG